MLPRNMISPTVSPSNGTRFIVSGSRTAIASCARPATPWRALRRARSVSDMDPHSSCFAHTEGGAVVFGQAIHVRDVEPHPLHAFDDGSGGSGASNEAANLAAETAVRFTCS